MYTEIKTDSIEVAKEVIAKLLDDGESSRVTLTKSADWFVIQQLEGTELPVT